MKYHSRFFVWLREMIVDKIHCPIPKLLSVFLLDGNFNLASLVLRLICILLDLGLLIGMWVLMELAAGLMVGSMGAAEMVWLPWLITSMHSGVVISLGEPQVWGSHLYLFWSSNFLECM